MYLLGQHAHLVFVLLVVAELYLDLEGAELDGVLEADGVGSLQDGLLCLLVQQVELHWVPAQKNLVLIKKKFNKLKKKKNNIIIIIIIFF